MACHFSVAGFRAAEVAFEGEVVDSESLQALTSIVSASATP
jgi:hypothetical protein